MHVVVTGANGFLGSRVVELALMKGAKVSAIVRNRQNFSIMQRNPRLQLIEWNIKDDDISHSDVEKLYGADMFFSCAVYKGANQEDPEEVAKCFSTNSVGAIKIANLIQKSGIARFIFISAANAYASKNIRAKEFDALYPECHASAYLASVVAAEFLINAFCKKNKIAHLILRASSIYGLGHGKSLVTGFVKKLLNGEGIVLEDGGEFSADFIFADDIINLGLNSQTDSPSGIYNIASGVRTSLLDLSYTISDCAGISRELIKIIPKQAASKVAIFPEIDITLAQKILFFKPTSLQAGVQQIIEMQKNKKI